MISHSAGASGQLFLWARWRSLGLVGVGCDDRRVSDASTVGRRKTLSDSASNPFGRNAHAGFIVALSARTRDVRGSFACLCLLPHDTCRGPVNLLHDSVISWGRRIALRRFPRSQVDTDEQIRIGEAESVAQYIRPARIYFRQNRRRRPMVSRHLSRVIISQSLDWFAWPTAIRAFCGRVRQHWSRRVIHRHCALLPLRSRSRRRQPCILGAMAATLIKQGTFLQDRISQAPARGRALGLIAR